MSQKDEVRITINKLFEAAGVRYTYRGEVTEQTAAIIGRVVADINSCTTALNWVPRPTGGKATITWVARNMAPPSLAKWIRKRSP